MTTKTIINDKESRYLEDNFPEDFNELQTNMSKYHLDLLNASEEFWDNPTPGRSIRKTVAKLELVKTDKLNIFNPELKVLKK